jgi:hypothetical protein
LVSFPSTPYPHRVNSSYETRSRWDLLCSIEVEAGAGTQFVERGLPSINDILAGQAMEPSGEAICALGAALFLSARRSGLGWNFIFFCGFNAENTTNYYQSNIYEPSDE